MTDRDRCRVASLIGVLEDQSTPHGERVRLAILKAEMLLLPGDAEPAPATSEIFPTPTQNRARGRPDRPGQRRASLPDHARD